MIELSEYRKEVKRLCLKMRVNTYCEFKACEYFDGLRKIPTDIMTKEDAILYQALHELRASYKGKVFDGLYRVVV